jgi:hypothetical protein
MPIASQQIKQLNYLYKVTVAAGPYSASTVVEGPSMTNFGGMGVTPRNVRLLLGAPTAASYSWTVTGPSGAVTVDQATEQFASFVPTAVGTYTITEGTWTKTINVGNFVSASNCRNCHNNTGSTNPKLKILGISKDEKAEAVSPILPDGRINYEAVWTESYPIARYLYVYSKGQPQGEVKQYLDWILGPQGQAIVEKIEYVPLPATKNARG